MPLCVPPLRDRGEDIGLLAEMILAREAGISKVLVVCPEMPARRNSPVPIVEFRSFPFPAYPEYRIGMPDARLPQAVRIASS